MEYGSDASGGDLADGVRAKAISIVQSSWAIGFAAAALLAGPVSRYFGWRGVFFLGILPALLTLWIRRGVPESEMWEGGPQTAACVIETETYKLRLYTILGDLSTTLRETDGGAVVV